MISNDEINVLRVQAYQKYGPTKMVRLRTSDDKFRFYLCTFRGSKILSVLAGGENYRELVSQL